MFFRSERRLFGLTASKARAALPRCTRRVAFSIESVESRASLSGITVINPGLICEFNPQPDPPARSALIGQPGATANALQSAPLHFDVPPGPC
jgi:hypothetical protein